MAVPAEQRIRPCERAVRQLLDTAGAGERGERDAAEERRRQRLHRQREIRSFVGTRGRAAVELPTSLVPRTEVVFDLEDDRTPVAVAPPRQSRTDVDEPHPAAVAHA